MPAGGPKLFADPARRAAGGDFPPRMRHIILGLHEDWVLLDDQIESVSSEIAEIGQSEAHCRDLRTIPGVEPIISTALSRRSERVNPLRMGGTWPLRSGMFRAKIIPVGDRRSVGYRNEAVDTCEKRFARENSMGRIYYAPGI